MSRNPSLTHHGDEELYDITAAAAAAEAAILEASAKDRRKSMAPVVTGTPETHRGPTAATDSAGGGNGGGGDEAAAPFPPVDIFAAPGHWTLHFSVPGVKRKEDVDVSWDGGRGAVVVKGVVSQPGDGESGGGLGSVVRSERRVGGFERAVEISVASAGDGSGVESELEDGVLVVRVLRG